MKITNAMQKPDLPDMMLLQPACMLALPNSVEVSDTLSVNGSGVGRGADSIKTALGEYLERRHFYREILSKKHGRLRETLTNSEVNSFTKAFAQTASNRMSIVQLEKHEFSLSEVFRLTDFSVCFVPTVCISLSPHSLEKDNFIYPLRDTCGCSFHWQSDVAFVGAIKEYLERQFLIRFWLTKMVCWRFDFVEVSSLLNNKNIRNLYLLLIASGEVTFLDVSDARFPGFCVLAAYGQKNNGAKIKYCSGMSYASNLTDAIEKSLLELWQTYRFMDLFKSLESEEGKIQDSYLRYFLSCNTYQTYEDVIDVSVTSCSRDVTSQSEFSLSVFLSVLNSLEISSYLYARRDRVNGVSCMLCKFISPDLFLHMNGGGEN